MTRPANIAAPIRIGLLNDMADGPPGPSDIAAWLRMAMEEAVARGQVAVPVEWVEAYGLGMPKGSVAAVEKAHRELVASGCVLVIGPAIGDNALGVTALVEELGVPTVHWAGAETARGEWMFQLQVGSHEEEAVLMARHLDGLGARRIAAIREDSPIGRKHMEFFTQECARLGLEIVSEQVLSPNATDCGSAVTGALERAPDAIAYHGLGQPVGAVAKALAETGWAGPRVMNSCGLRGYHAGLGAVLEGWAYCDLVSDGNRELAALLARLGLGRDRAFAAAKGWDLGRIAAEAVARAPTFTPAGLREGLERIKWLPAAEGMEGTLLGFGRQDRGGLHGRYLVMRQWRGGASLEIAQP